MAKPQPPKPAAKASVQCPHCGNAQQESTHAQTTVCRKCGQYFKIGQQPASAAAASEEPSKAAAFFKKLGRILTGERILEIKCFNCACAQTVSSAAESTMCPQCGIYMDLRDYKIKGVNNRAISTHGTVTVTADGDVVSPKIICGNAVIRGKIQGAFDCAGKASIKYQGRMLGSVDAEHLVIEKASELEFVKQVKAGLLEVCGKMSARVVARKVKIAKKGRLEGTVYAKAIEVEQGGILAGELHIGGKEPTQPELPATKEPAPDLFTVKQQKSIALGRR